MIFRCLAFSFFISCVFSTDPICFFSPAKNWQIVVPKKDEKFIKIAFVEKTSSFFKPSINLAYEKTDATITQYLQAITKIYSEDPHTSYKELDQIPTKAGNAELLKLTMQSKVGQSTLLQMILLKDGYAYVMSAAVIDKDFIKTQKIFLDMFRSFQIEKDLFSAIKDPKQKKLLQQKHEEYSVKKDNKSIKTFEKFLAKEFAYMGSYFHMLILKQAFLEN